MSAEPIDTLEATERNLIPEEEIEELQLRVGDLPEDGTLLLSKKEATALLRHIATLADGLIAEAGVFCRVCGCSDNNSCEGSCFWIEYDLCSACGTQDGVDGGEE